MKKIWFFILAFVITISAALYQRATGPTYPKKVKITLNNKEYKFKLPRSCEGNDSCAIKLVIPDKAVSGFLFFKRYKFDESYTAMVLKRVGDTLIAKLPGQSPAGKLEYYIEFEVEGDKVILPNNNSIVIRYKGIVPDVVLALHIFFMFFAMLWSNYAGLLAIAGKEGYFKAGVVTLLLIFLGGMILGPIVQKFAFDEYWAGVPYGWDLTDNKTLIAFIAWVWAILFNMKRKNRWYILIAAIITIIIFSIPHSLYGSELNYETGIIQQG